MSMQILPPKTSVSNEFGQALYKGLSEGSEQGFQRNQVQNALSNLGQLPPNATPFDTAKQLISAFAGIPGGEAYVSQLMPYILMQMKRQALQPGAQSVLPQAQEGINGMPQASQRQPTNANPNFSGIVSAEDIDRIAQNYPGDPADVWNYYNGRNQAILNQKDLYRSYLQDRTGVTDPSTLAVLDRISNEQEFKGIRDPLQKADLVAKKFQKYEATKDAFKREGAIRPNPLRSHANYLRAIENLKSSAKPLIDQGQYDEAKQNLAQGQWSENEIAQILNPLKESTLSQIEKLPHEPTRGLISAESRQRAANAIARYEDALEKIIKPGITDPTNNNLLKPGTSLFLLRNEMQKKGVPWDQFDRMLNRLIATGRINLDPEQERERVFMSKHPSRGYSIWETLFGPQ
jgi:tetratricopeptide (TPR) repeat protein